MNLSQAIEIIEKSQEDINDKVLLGEEPYPPDEYFLAVGKVLPYLKCLECMAKQAVTITVEDLSQDATLTVLFLLNLTQTNYPSDSHRLQHSIYLLPLKYIKMPERAVTKTLMRMCYQAPCTFRFLDWESDPDTRRYILFFLICLLAWC